MGNAKYAHLYRDIDFRKHPEKYIVGKGEQGVLIAEPYKSEILPYWRFATPADAKHSADKILSLFYQYKQQNDFVGMDMARKFLQMGFTRSRRYANHSSGRIYAKDGTILAQSSTAMTSDKAQAARIFRDAYRQAKNDPHYLILLKQYKENHGPAAPAA
jgi:hypothetical protein